MKQNKNYNPHAHHLHQSPSRPRNLIQPNPNFIFSLNSSTSPPAPRRQPVAELAPDEGRDRECWLRWNIHFLSGSSRLESYEPQVEEGKKEENDNHMLGIGYFYFYFYFEPFVL